MCYRQKGDYSDKSRHLNLEKTVFYTRDDQPRMSYKNAVLRYFIVLLPLPSYS
ncbi:hypothetical protein IF1G_08101 [Cordyceps javanica]|uniref:Uncharacterized protein n=1 Tax=Cordyceps javanica TaxID=43265 RepID=A0A545UVN5_9HYPO|nr:hypothetical protein IF1G_08101 [Cordyceps javanica]